MSLILRLINRWYGDKGGVQDYIWALGYIVIGMDNIMVTRVVLWRVTINGGPSLDGSYIIKSL